MTKKKVEPIKGLPDNPDDKLTVQKSYPLYSLWKSEMTLTEFKILDTYLARINSHEPDKRLVQFEKGEIEQILGVKKINLPDLKNRLNHLMSNVVEVPDSSVKRGFRLVSIFEEAQCEQDDYGLWQIKLECTQKAMKYFFDIEHLGYIRYKLRCITSLTSRYSYIMFTYLEKHRHMGLNWTVDIMELKEILGCDGEESYKEFKKFNQKVLKRCHEELTEKTECRYTYEPVKKGRSVVEIRFKLESIAAIEDPEDAEDPDQITIDDYIPDTVTLKDDYTSFIRGACTDREGKCEFSQEELEEIATVLVTVPEYLLPDVPGIPDDIKFRQYHYLKEKYAALNTATNRRQIKYRHSYLMQMIKKDSNAEL